MIEAARVGEFLFWVVVGAGVGGILSAVVSLAAIGIGFEVLDLPFYLDTGVWGEHEENALVWVTNCTKVGMVIGGLIAAAACLI